MSSEMSVEPMSVEPVPIEEPLTVEVQFGALLVDLTTLKNHLTDIQSKFRFLEKQVAKELKGANQSSKKTTTSTATIKNPLGFSKPVKVTPELCLFMKKPEGTLVSRTEVTQYITNHIRDHKLQDMTDRKRIQPDEALSALLKLPENAVITYFNLQRYLNPLFIKTI